MNLIPFTLSSQTYTPFTGNSVESNCAGITFVNIGQDPVSVLGIVLQQNASFSPPCNIGEIDETNYIYQFAGTNADQRLVVIRKNYKI